MWTYWSTLGLALLLIIDHLRVLRQNINGAAPCWGSWWSREWSWKCSVFINRLKVSWNRSSLQLTDMRDRHARSKRLENKWSGHFVQLSCSVEVNIYSQTQLTVKLSSHLFILHPLLHRFTSLGPTAVLSRNSGSSSDSASSGGMLSFPCTSLVKFWVVSRLEKWLIHLPKRKR